jgi:hypothetical protein
MAELDFVRYKSGRALGVPPIAEMRMLEEYVDFTLAANQTAGVSDSLNIFELPKGTVVFAGGIEQVVAGTAGQTYLARVGTTALSGTLASDAAVGTLTANAAVDAQTLTSAADFNILSATAVRATGVVRVWCMVLEAKKPTGRPGLAVRDFTA